MKDVKIQNHVGWELLDDVSVVVSLKGGAYYHFEGSAKLIWDSLVSGLSPEQITNIFKNKYNITQATACDDINHFLEQLAQEDLIIYI